MTDCFPSSWAPSPAPSAGAALAAALGKGGGKRWGSRRGAAAAAGGHAGTASQQAARSEDKGTEVSKAAGTPAACASPASPAMALGSPLAFAAGSCVVIDQGQVPFEGCLLLPATSAS